MIVRQRSRIHALAIKTMQEIRIAYSNRLFKSSRSEQINSLHDFLTNDDDISDQDIVTAFNAALVIERKKTGSSGEENSIFLNKLTDFLEKAELILENIQLKKTISDLESQIRNPCYFQLLYKQSELVDRIFFFLAAMGVNQVIVDEHDYALFHKHYDDMNRLCLVSKDFHKRITNEKFQINLAKNKKNDLCAFYSTGNMHVFLNTLTGKSYTLNVNSKDCVDHLKNVVESVEGVPPAQQNLMFCRRPLENGKTLDEYGIQKEATILLTLKLRGD